MITKGASTNAHTQKHSVRIASHRYDALHSHSRKALRKSPKTEFSGCYVWRNFPSSVQIQRLGFFSQQTKKK